MGMGATASGPTGAKDEYVVTYCGVRARDAPRSSPSRRDAPLARDRRLPPPRALGHAARLAGTTFWRPALTTPPATPIPPRAELRRGPAGVRRRQGRHPARAQERQGGSQPRRLLSHHRHRSKLATTDLVRRQQKLFAKNGRPAQAEIMSLARSDRARNRSSHVSRA